MSEISALACQSYRGTEMEKNVKNLVGLPLLLRNNFYLDNKSGLTTSAACVESGINTNGVKKGFVYFAILTFLSMHCHKGNRFSAI